MVLIYDAKLIQCALHVKCRLDSLALRWLHFTFLHKNSESAHNRWVKFSNIKMVPVWKFMQDLTSAVEVEAVLTLKG